MSRLVLSALFLLSSFSVTEAVFAGENPIQRFYQVSPGIYRGARPEKAGVEFLKKAGFKTIINIDNDVYAVGAELKEADRVGLRMLSYPLSSWAFPPDETVNEILRELNNPDNHPVFLHCQHGQDRTGLIVGLQRVEYEAVSATKAYREMRNLGFHRSLVFLYEYYKARTGFRSWFEEI